MIDNLPPEVTSRWFSWNVALRGHYDVIHFQWPEKIVHADSKAKGFVKRVALDVVILRARLQRKPVIVTLHNLDSHEGTVRSERRALERLYRHTDEFIVLNDEDSIDTITSQTPVVIPHGDYSQKYTPTAAHGSPHRAVFFGLIREYKNVPSLIRAFNRIERPDWALSVIGNPWDDHIAREVQNAAGTSSRVTLKLAEIEEDELVNEIASSGLVVLPYRRLYNSGAIFLALTLARPVLAPSTPTTRALLNEFGRKWIVLYEGELTPAHIQEAMESVETGLVGRGVPDMSRRDWSTIGAQYGDLYRASMMTKSR